jgi:CubicO group peptidase (beta-lactamase class C family)
VDHAIPGISIAVINDYHLEWACGYGMRKRGGPERVDPETAFQACSINKAVTAIAILRLVEEGRLDLDADVNLFLKSWKVPANGPWRPKVTIRQLLSHTAGQPAMKLVKQSDMSYAFAHMDDTITFVKNGQGNVQALILQQGAAETLR